MITRITTHISGPNSDGSTWTIDLAEDWDKVFNKVFPAQAPSSQLEHRENMWFTKSDGHRICMPPSAIYCVEELPDETE